MVDCYCHSPEKYQRTITMSGTGSSSHSPNISQNEDEDEDDSDEIRDFLRSTGSDPLADAETDAAIASIFDGGGGSSGSVGNGSSAPNAHAPHPSSQSQQQQQQLVQPQLFQQGNHYARDYPHHHPTSLPMLPPASLPPLPPQQRTSMSDLQQHQQQQQQLRMWQSQMNPNDPFAALMSATTAAAAAMDGEVAARANAANANNAAVAAALAASDTMKIGTPLSTSAQDEFVCVRCQYPGSDVRIISCQKGCTYHARCIDLLEIVNSQPHTTHDFHSPQDSPSIKVHTCPNCNSHANGLEILPLSFDDMDRAQKINQGRIFDATGGFGMELDNRKRSNADRDEVKPTNSSIPNALLSSVPPASSYSQSSSQCYDPTIPRTGRWTDEELAFRDSLIAHFLEGSLPLSNGLKLNDFLSNILKSKQSRLTKKMKHAKLSTKYFHIKRGFIFENMAAREFSRLEYSFIHVITDPIERSEIQFHMEREWREHLAERCSYLRIAFEGSAWIRSVEQCDQRVALEKNRSRTIKRKWMMGKAMEKDVGEKSPGVFIDKTVESEDPMDGLDGKDSDFGRFLMSIVDEAGTSVKNFDAASSGLNAAQTTKKSAIRSQCDPNFKCAAPFLAGITSYIEKNSIPFEHVDVWVPSFVSPDSEQMRTGTLGSGSNPTSLPGDGQTCRLCFGGSATMSQVVEESRLDGLNSQPIDADKKDSVKVTPLTSEETFNFSLFGDYSEKFSFSSGCGLPGRVFQSGIAAWEQFVSNAPSHLFERRGGAVQFGIKTALGLPIESPNVGRIVLVLYSKHNRDKNEELVKQIVKDMRLFNPSPRWKLVIDVNSTKEEQGSKNPLVRPGNNQIASLRQASVAHTSSHHMLPSQAATTAPDGIKNLISLLGENMPSDSNSPLGQQLNDLMSLRLVLLRPHRTPEEQQLVDTIMVLFESYLAAGRSKQDIALLLCRDFIFHNDQNARASSLQHQQRTLASQQQLQNFASSQQQQANFLQSSIFHTLGGLSQSLPSSHTLVGGQQESMHYAFPPLALQQQQMQQLTMPPPAYLANRPNSAKDDESLGTSSAGGHPRR